MAWSVRPCLRTETMLRVPRQDLKYEFYDAVLRDVTEVETVWIVGEFGADDPLVARLRQGHHNVRKAVRAA